MKRNYFFSQKIRKQFPDLHILAAFLKQSLIYRCNRCLGVKSMWNQATQSKTGTFQEHDCCEFQKDLMCQDKFPLGLESQHHRLCLWGCTQFIYNSSAHLYQHYDVGHIHIFPGCMKEFGIDGRTLHNIARWSPINVQTMDVFK